FVTASCLPARWRTVERIGASALRDPFATARSGTRTAHSLDRRTVAAILGWKGHAGRTIRPALRLELHRAGTALDEPATGTATHPRLDEVTRIAACGDAPASERKRIEIRTVDLRSAHCGLARTAFLAIPQDRRGKAHRARLVDGLGGGHDDISEFARDLML